MTNIEVQLVNLKMEQLTMIRLPSNTIPTIGTQFHTRLSKDGIYKNSEYLVENVIYEYVQIDNHDGYGGTNESTMKVKLVVTLLSFETNEPTPVKKAKATKNK